MVVEFFKLKNLYHHLLLELINLEYCNDFQLIFNNESMLIK